MDGKKIRWLSFSDSKFRYVLHIETYCMGRIVARYVHLPIPPKPGTVEYFL
jgi:hypothetical protein